jgi:hypothetical protein
VLLVLLKGIGFYLFGSLFGLLFSRNATGLNVMGNLKEQGAQEGMEIM